MNSPADDTLDQVPYALRPRPVVDWCNMAVVTQANLVSLRVRQCRAAGIEADRHEIRTRSPGAIRRMREHLLDRGAVAGMSVNDLGLRLRQVWGQFSAFCWLFDGDDANDPPGFGERDHEHARCPTELAVKVEEVRQSLWRIRFEQQLRFVGEFRLRPDFHELKLAAGEIKVEVYGRPVHNAPPQELVLSACETAGVMSALRWAMDDRWGWEQRGISDVGLE